jgi:histone deacetylase 1/2
VEEALNGKNAKEWEMAMQEEYDPLVVNNTWSLVPFPKGRKPISYKWVFKIKHGVDGEVEHYKARFVARGEKLQRNFCTYFKVCVNSLYPDNSNH